MNEIWQTVSAGLERLAAAAGALEATAARLERDGERVRERDGERDGDAQRGEVGKITAAIETGAPGKPELGLQQRLERAEQALLALQASQAEGAARDEARAAVRKTLPAATVQLLAKGGIEAGDAVDVGSLDAALASLSIEQRIAVKSQMMRTGALKL